MRHDVRHSRNACIARPDGFTACWVEKVSHARLDAIRADEHVRLMRCPVRELYDDALADLPASNHLAALCHTVAHLLQQDILKDWPVDDD
eukprot:scaffold240797_cov35-Tisochrysis_lutea.AAC.5